MAGAKETPRQKLISLMYLVFITMLALNVSKEVLDGFGQMFEKITDANERVLESNNLLLENIIVNAEEKGGKWIGHKITAEQIKKESDAFYNEIEGLKKRITEKQRELEIKNEDLPYEQRDHALFVAFAPFKDPRYAISVVIEHGGSGSKAAAPPPE